MTKNIKRWCWEMDLTPKETRFIINYLRSTYDDKSIKLDSKVDEEDLIEALEELKLTHEYNGTYYNQYGVDIDEYFESVMAGASGISDAAPENIINLEEGKKKCKEKGCKDSDDCCCNDDLIDVGLDDYGGRRYGGNIDKLVNEFLEKEFKK